jgi:glutathione synthase
VYTTYLLERAESEGTLVVNRPQSLRDANEKLFTAWFAELCPATLVTRQAEDIRGFLREHGTIILKPLGSMGGASIFKVTANDPNTNVIIETLTDSGARFAMVQRFVPEINLGDKRILLIDGEPVPYALARIPAQGETRGNLAAGARGEGVVLSDADLHICARLGPEMRRRGLVFVGLDVIGDCLTEVNVTSPTCIRELDEIYGLDIAAQIMDAVQARLPHTDRRHKRD